MILQTLPNSYVCIISIHIAPVFLTPPIVGAQWQSGMTNGALIGVPIPANYEAVGAEIQRAVDQAVIESEQNGMSKRGKDVTPWILNRVSELTQGKSIESSESISSAATCAFDNLLHRQTSRCWRRRPLLVSRLDFVDGQLDSAKSNNTAGSIAVEYAKLQDCS
jgi:hypothetical protein